MTQPQPQRCAVAACGRQPTQVEYYETNPGATDAFKGAAGMPVCSGHTGIGNQREWRLAGVVPVGNHATAAKQ